MNCSETSVPMSLKNTQQVWNTTAAMQTQAEHYERTSQAQFADMPVPETAQTYDPLTVSGLEMPALTGGGLESIADMATKEGVTEEDLCPK